MVRAAERVVNEDHLLFTEKFYGKLTILQEFRNERTVTMATVYVSVALTTFPPAMAIGVWNVRNSPMMLSYQVLRQNDWYCSNGALFLYGVLQLWDLIFALLSFSVLLFAVYALGEPVLNGAYILKALG